MCRSGRRGPILEFGLLDLCARHASRRWANAIRKRTNPHRKGPGHMASAALKRIKKKLPERLAEVRGDRSQRQFARDLGVFQQNVNRYENGTTPHTDFLITLSTKENVSLDWLLLGKGKMRRSR
ncbi:MAG: hypothetical protein CL933_17400 [Deltaproteobacteria bacterium]|nr:hypothetical protein [Deltaproteobacteria bacterium]